VTILCKRIPPETFENTYKIQLPRSIVNGKRLPFGARELLQLYSTRRGYMRSGHSGPDESRGARDLLKDYVSGKLLYCMPPPSNEVKTSLIMNELSTKSNAAPDAPVSQQPRLVVGGHLVQNKTIEEGGELEQIEFNEQEMEDRMKAMELSMTQASVAYGNDDESGTMEVLAPKSGDAPVRINLNENDFDDDFFAIDGEDVELKEQHVKKAHRSFGRRLKGKHKARRAVDAAYPTPYETGTSRTGGEDIYGLNASGVDGEPSASGGILIAKGKKKKNRKFKRNNR
jgi:hypothetical protein